MHLRLERLSVAVVPGVRGYVPAVDEDRGGIPVRQLTRQEVTALEQQDLLTGGREGVGQRSATRSAADDDHVIPIGHGLNMPADGELHITPRGWCQGDHEQER